MGTSGLVSEYQLVSSSAQIVMRNNLADTNAQEFFPEIVTYPDALKLREMELIKVKVPSQYESLVLALLSKRVPVQILPDSILIITRGALRILREVSIPYEIIE